MASSVRTPLPRQCSRPQRHRSRRAPAMALGAVPGLVLHALVSPRTSWALRIDWSCCDDKYAPLTVSEGDPIEFHFAKDGSVNNVYQFWGKADYDACNFNNAQFLGGVAQSPSVSVATHSQAGVTMYFASQNGPSCRVDEWPQKVEVSVTKSITGGEDVGGGEGGGGAGSVSVDCDAACIKACTIKFSKKKKMYCSNLQAADAGGHRLAIMNGLPKFKDCDKACLGKPVPAAASQGVDTLQFKNKCFGYEYDNFNGQGVCKLYDTTMDKGDRQPIDQARAAAGKKELVLVVCGTLKSELDPRCPAQPRAKSWSTKSMAMANPNEFDTPSSLSAVDFETYEGSKCQSDLLGKIMLNFGVHDDCRIKCAADDTCGGYEYDPEGRRCKLFAEPPRPDEKNADVQGGYRVEKETLQPLCAARIGADS